MTSVNVLVIDDDEIMTFLFGRALTSYELNCNFHCLPSAEEALHYLDENEDRKSVV